MVKSNNNGHPPQVNFMAFTGVLTQDATLQTTRKGSPKVSMRVAIPRRVNPHKADHVTVIGIGKRFMQFADLGTGSWISVQGEIRQKDLQDGRTAYEVQARLIAVIEAMPRGEAGVEAEEEEAVPVDLL